MILRAASAAAGVLAAVAVVAACAGCSGSGGGGGTSAGAPPGESGGASGSGGSGAPATTSATPQPTVTPPDADCGRLTVKIVGVQGGYEQIVGTHAEWPSSAGQFVRVRLNITNLDGTFHTFHTQTSVLVDADGTRTVTSRDATRIKRQNEDFTLGGENIGQFDIWYDLKKTAHPATLLLYQDLHCVRPLKLPAMTGRD